MMNEEEYRQSVISRYSSDEDVKTYRDRYDQGLRLWERHIVDRYMAVGSVLNIGCGGGRECFALEDLGYSPQGLDVSKQQVESARSIGKRLDSKVEFTWYDGSAIPFDDGQFSAVTLWSQVLGNVPGSEARRRLLGECRRILCDGGIVSASVHDSERSMARIEKSGEQYDLTIPVDGETGDLLLETPSGIRCYWHYFSPAEFRSEFEESGFEIVLESTSDKLGQDWDNLDIIVGLKATLRTP